jgi:hypothetical protein
LLEHRPCLQPCHRSPRHRRRHRLGLRPWLACRRSSPGWLWSLRRFPRCRPLPTFRPSHCRPMRRRCPLRRRLVRRSPSLPRLRTRSHPSLSADAGSGAAGANLPAGADGARPAGCATRAWPGSTAAAVLGVVGRARGGQNRQCGNRELPRISAACHRFLLWFPSWRMRLGIDRSILIGPTCISPFPTPTLLGRRNGAVEGDLHGVAIGIVLA